MLIIGTYDVNGKLDMPRFHPIAFEPAHNGYHVPGERVGDAFRDGLTLKQVSFTHFFPAGLPRRDFFVA